MKNIQYNSHFFKFTGRIGRIDFICSFIILSSPFLILEYLILLFGGPLNKFEVTFDILNIIKLIYMPFAFYFHLNNSFKRERDIKGRELTNKENIILTILLIFPLISFFMPFRYVFIAGLTSQEPQRYDRIKICVFLLLFSAFELKLLTKESSYWAHYESYHFSNDRDIVIPLSNDEYFGKKILTKRRTYLLFDSMKNEKILITSSLLPKKRIDIAFEVDSYPDVNLQLIQPNQSFTVTRKIILKSFLAVLKPAPGNEYYVVKDQNQIEYLLPSESITDLINQNFLDNVSSRSSTYDILSKFHPQIIIACTNDKKHVSNILENYIDNNSNVEVQIMAGLNRFKTVTYDILEIGFQNYEDENSKKTCAKIFINKSESFNRFIFFLDLLGREINLYTENDLLSNNINHFYLFDNFHYKKLSIEEFDKYKRSNIPQIPIIEKQTQDPVEEPLSGAENPSPSPSPSPTSI